MTTALKRISQLNQIPFMDAYNSAVFQKTAAQKIFYVDSTTGTDSASRSGEDIRSPFATIDYAINKCTAGNLDTIIVLPMHAETVTSSITMDVAGVAIHGLRNGNKKPIISPNGTIDAITVTADNCEITGLHFAGPGTTAQTADINIAAAYCRVADCSHIAGLATEVKTNVYTLTSAANYALLEDIYIMSAVVECSAAISLEGAADGIEIRRVRIFDSIGFTLGSLDDAAACTNLFVHHCWMENEKADEACINYTSNSQGVTCDCVLAGHDSTILNNITPGSAMDFFEVYVTEHHALNGIVGPAVDAE